MNETQVVAFSGIAAPEGFYRSLLASGLSLIATKSYPDHYPFSAADLGELRKLYPNFPLVCTEKDAIKLRSLPKDLLDRIFVIKVSARVVPTDAFMVQIERILRD